MAFRARCHAKSNPLALFPLCPISANLLKVLADVKGGSLKPLVGLKVDGLCDFF
jgi:hypothetical protein